MTKSILSRKADDARGVIDDGVVRKQLVTRYFVTAYVVMACVVMAYPVVAYINLTCMAYCVCS